MQHLRGLLLGQLVSVLVSGFSLSKLNFWGKAPAEASGAPDDAWHEVTEWLRSNGAVVNSKAAGSLTQHGSFSVRGVLAEQPIEKGEVLLSIPKSLWLHLDNVEPIRGLENLSCGVYLRPAVAIALEIKKGPKSKWYTYLKNLPTLENYNSFLLAHASNETLAQFDGLEMARILRLRQKEWNEEMWPCLKTWKQQYGHDDLTWEDLQLARAHWSSRAYWLTGVHDNDLDRRGALIPASDLLNTDRSSLLNTDWRSKKLPRPAHNESDFAFELVAAQSVGAKKELFDSYCAGCTNWELLSGWSVYLDDNDRREPPDAVSPPPTLQKNVFSLLSTRPGGTAPLCKDELLSGEGEEQGFIKCALARLAWEQNSKDWGVPETVRCGNLRC